MSKGRKQCKKCPWRTDVDPFDIPDGYCPTKHAGLESTIGSDGEPNLTELRIMACHESKPGAEVPCVGWLANQLGPGNNIGLRIAVSRGRIDGRFALVGKQHKTFQDTLPPLGLSTPSNPDGTL